MAGTITHTYFSKDVYKKLDEKSKNNIKGYEGSFELFSQGHDIFFFNCNRKTSSLGKYFHKNNTQNFFINIIKYIVNNNLKDNKEIMSYLYGYICHYALDSTIHPYVTYKGGYYNKKKKETIKYNGKHSDIESYIDAYMINKHENIEPNKLNLRKFCFNNKKLSNDLIKLINEVFKETYNYENMGNKYKRCITNMRISYSLLRNDKYGIKKKAYIFLDKITPKSFQRFSPISLKYKLNKNYYYLNLDHRKWNHPRYKDETYTLSVLDLYNNACDLSLNLINSVNDVIYNNKDINSLKKVFKNISFSSGKDCNDNTKNKYFEY